MKKWLFVLSVLLIVGLLPWAWAEEASNGEYPVETFRDPELYLAYRLSLPKDAPFDLFAYENDPAENAKAMADVLANPDAVFGFAPSPDSARLKDFVDALDWTNPQEVAKARETRRAYHDSMAELYRLIENMLLNTEPVESIARAVSKLRNEIRLRSYANDPEGLSRVKQSNLDTYGDEMGPTADSLYEKYGSWQRVLEKALGTNAGMNACLGFYDEFFELYDLPVE